MFSRLKTFAKSYKDLIPMSLICWKEGYTASAILSDAAAGFTVGLIALPLAMAFAIGSGVTPERGLYTAIIAGFLISLLGGSRVQIGGPTGAFVIIVYDIVQRQGYDGLAIATLLAGVMLVLMGLARFGVFLKFIPYPVTVGFTAGIALVIFSSQIKDFFGLSMAGIPSDFFEKWTAYWNMSSSWNPAACSIAAGTLAMIFALRRFFPKIPGVILSVIAATLATVLLDLPIETIQTKFGGIPNTLPIPSLPEFSLDKMQAVFPDAIAIALLGAIESLLSAVVADGMTGHRHRSNCELIAQGIANIGSILFGGIPATGAIARTSANVKLGAKTPLSGMIHAVTLFVLMAALAPLASKVPLAALAAVLVYIAWNMSDIGHFREIMKGTKSDTLVLLTTFFLTVAVDLTVAVLIGVILSAMLFVKRMSDATTVKVCKALLEENSDEHPAVRDSEIIFQKNIPADTAVFEIIGPFFFAVSDLLNEELRQLTPRPKVFILRMRQVPTIDAAGVHALKQFSDKCRQMGIIFLLSGVKPPMEEFLKKSGVADVVGVKQIYPHLDDALQRARNIVV